MSNLLRKLKRTAAVGALLTAVVAPSLYIGMKYETDFDGHRHVATSQHGEFKVPTFNPVKLGGYNCSKYSRLVSEAAFGKHFIPCNACDQHYVNVDKGRVSNENIFDKINDGTLEPGMIVTVNVKGSSYLDKKDMYGKKVESYHATTYLGTRPTDGQPLFAEQRGYFTRVSALSDLKSKGDELVRIIDSAK